MKKHIILTLALIFISFTVNLAARTDIAGFCYHQIEPVASGKFSLSLEKFTAQLEYLHQRSYKTLNSEELLAALASDGPQIDKSVIITFDDGFLNVYNYAFPVMKKFGFKGIVCIYPSFIGSKSAMSWQQLQELIDAGWSVECHSMSHSNLASHYADLELEKKFLDKEIIASRDIIENRLKNKVRFMVWPYGVYTDRTLKLVRDSGFAGAITVDGGASYKGLSPYQVKRQVIYSTDDMNKFLIRFGMSALPASQQYPEPGQVVAQLATFTCRLDDLADYSPEKYVLNAKVTGKKVDFSFDAKTRILTGKISSAFKPGNYFIDIYLRDKATGVTAQNGWLFSIAGKSSKTSY
ncbi:MAG: polysaccharide deacetylase family protein [Candidatus Riflebacteria bacterium]|nr:polysaccharide deacetylase family protein [Candidatus Riflebacteria bacterium]